MKGKAGAKSITFKMSMYMALLIIFLMAAVGLGNYCSTRSSIEGQNIDKGWSIVRSATAFSAEHLQAGNPDLLEEQLQNIRANDDVSYAAIINAAGKIVAHSDQKRVGQSITFSAGPPAKNTVGIYNGADGKPAGYDFISPIVSKGGSTLGYFQMGLDIAKQRAMLVDLILNMLMISFAAVVAGIMLARVMAGRILRTPITDLKEATEHIASGDFSHKVPVRQLDELGGLASAFNSMTGHLANLFMSVRTSAAEMTRSSQVILSRAEDFRVAVERGWPGDGQDNAPAGINTRQMESLREISISAKKMARLVDRLNSLSLQFKL